MSHKPYLSLNNKKLTTLKQTACPHQHTRLFWCIPFFHGTTPYIVRARKLGVPQFSGRAPSIKVIRFNFFLPPSLRSLWAPQGYAPPVGGPCLVSLMKSRWICISFTSQRPRRGKFCGNYPENAKTPTRNPRKSAATTCFRVKYCRV